MAKKFDNNAFVYRARCGNSTVVNFDLTQPFSIEKNRVLVRTSEPNVLMGKRCESGYPTTRGAERPDSNLPQTYIGARDSSSYRRRDNESYRWT